MTRAVIPLWAVITVVTATPPPVTVTRWVSPDSSRPGTFRDWYRTRPASKWCVRPITTAEVGFDDRVAVLVEETLLPSLRASIDTLLSDLARAGYQARAFALSGTAPESLRAFLQAEYDSGLVAATLVGDLPIAWFQLLDDWNGNGVRDPDEDYEEFPCDLYFMDLDGIWQDNWVRYDTFDSLVPGQDSIYDSHLGAVSPEIGITRLPVATLGRSDSLLRLYFAKVHQYRTGQLTVTDRALVYIDDDWFPWALLWNNNVGLLYPDRVFIADSEQTRVADYRPRIDTAAYQWLQLCAHSWPGGHALKFNHGQHWDWFYATWIPGLNPEACFYNLFACSNVRFTETGYCGGRYVFQTATGLAAIGSTKTGSMLEFQDYYGPLGSGAPIALAFKSWFAQQATGGFDSWERSWFYGMCQIGEALLQPRLQVAVGEPRPAQPLTLWTRPRPSPVRNRLRVELTLAAATWVRIRLADRAGRIIISLPAQLLGTGSHIISLDVSRLATGAYTLLVDAGMVRDRRTIVHIN